ncbi:MAG: hypothetical protein NWE88_08745 [Candidatus Bathyarchaeota archaeon]|nr:hypothetical protein [Candidatus Bathyarchaeota archaeon]
MFKTSWFLRTKENYVKVLMTLSKRAALTPPEHHILPGIDHLHGALRHETERIAPDSSLTGA